MVVRGIGLTYYRSLVIAEKYDITIEAARKLKAGGVTDIEDEPATKLIVEGFAEEVIDDLHFEG